MANRRETQDETQEKDKAQDDLDEAFDELERATPDSVTKAIRWLRQPQARVVRIPLGLLLMAASFLWFLPVLGLWFLPLGLLLIAQDVRFLRRPVGRMTLYLLDRWKRLRKYWAKRRAAKAARRSP
jgi:hypothetical protein